MGRLVTVVTYGRTLDVGTLLGIGPKSRNTSKWQKARKPKASPLMRL